MGFGLLLLSFFLTVWLTSHDIVSHDAVQAGINMTRSEEQTRAIQTVQYINTINDYLYDNPQSDGVIDNGLLGVTPPSGVAHILQSSRVFVYQPDLPGLMTALQLQSVNSALLGRVTSRRLIDNLGNDMQVTVPDVIPDGDLVYLN